MATIKIHNWKVTDEDDTNSLVFIPPEYHPTYWEVPKWWYKGDRTVYTSCVRVDVNDVTSIYIDGTTPLMQITIDWDNVNTVKFQDVRDIRRILVCAKDDIGVVNRGESDEYTDVEFLQGNNYIIRYDNYFGPDVIQPLQKEIKPAWADGDNSGPYYLDPIPFTTGTFVGGIEPISYGYRHAEREKEGDEWTKPTGYFDYDNTVTEKTLQLDGKSKAKSVQIICRAEDAEGTVAYVTSPVLDIYNPVPVITELPVLSSFNQYVVGEEVVGFAGAFTGGAPGAYARARWRWRDSLDGVFTGDEWTMRVDPLQEVRSSPIPAGMVQAKFQYQVIEPNTDTGSGNRQIQVSTETLDVTDPPGDPDPTTSWGAVIVYVNGDEYNSFIGAPVNVRVGDPIQLKVEWEGNATGTTLWSQRAGGSAELDDATSAEPVATMTAPGSTTLTITLTDPNGFANPPSTSKVVNFWAYVP